MHMLKYFYERCSWIFYYICLWRKDYEAHVRRDLSGLSVEIIPDICLRRKTVRRETISYCNVLFLQLNIFYYYNCFSTVIESFSETKIRHEL